jgi:spore coat protein U-like protein
MKNKHKILRFLLLIVSASILSGQQQVTTNLDVTAVVPEAVTVSATTLDFGILHVVNTTDGTATITVNASPALNYHIALDAGLNYESPARNVEFDKELIQYFLYKDAAYTEEWGDSDYANTYPMGSSAGPFLGIGAEQVYTVYGRAANSGGLVTGTYTDTVTVTIQF